jgi:hypothetical protein
MNCLKGKLKDSSILDLRTMHSKDRKSMSKFNNKKNRTKKRMTMMMRRKGVQKKMIWMNRQNKWINN